MQVMELREEVEGIVDEELINKARKILKEKRKEILAAEQVLKRLQERYIILCSMEVSEFVLEQENSSGGFSIDADGDLTHVWQHAVL